MKKYRIAVTMTEHGYVEVQAENKAEALEKAQEESDSGGFVGINSEGSIGEIIEVKQI